MSDDWFCRGHAGDLARVLLMGLLAAAVQPGPAAAHKVIGMAFADGTTIEGEIGYSNGDFAEPGTIVEVFGPDGEGLGQATVGASGAFTFFATRRVDHHFVATLGPGHRIEFEVPAEELPVALETVLDPLATAEAAGSPPTDAASKPVQVAMIPTARLSAEAIEAMVAEAVGAQVRPLRRELAELREHTGWRDVLGGVGYIFGLFGVAAYVAVLRRRYG